jgi:eukaryotic-like serine/threonine-protein kinase
MMLSAGTCLGRYEILAPLGAGGMGEVYRARDVRLDRTVALKVLPADVGSDAARHERFRREAHAISRLAHPHICTVHDVGDQDGVEFLVMEYLAGETLAHRLLRGPLPLDEALQIGVALASGLEAAHREGIVHRDLKPANIMLTPSGPKILDFGLAKWVDPPAGAADHRNTDSSLTQSGFVIGSAPYMAPEQAEGKPVDARSDLFALGAILYEMTTGRRAFEGTSPSSTLAAILTASPPPMAELQPLTPATFERLVRRCLARDPAARWQCTSDLAYELNWIRQSGIQVTGHPGRPVRSRREALAWVTAAAACAVAVLVYFISDRFTEAQPASSVRFDIRPPAGTSGLYVPVVSPDGQNIAFVARTPDDGKFFVWVRSMNSLEFRKIVEADDQAFPFWSPDGRSIAFFARGALRRIDLERGPAQVLCDAPAGRGGTWNRDGIIVFAPSPNKGLYRIPAGGGVAAPLTVLRPEDFSHRFPHFFPDGRHFSYVALPPLTAAGEKPKIMVGSLDSAEVTSVADGTLSEAWAPPGYLLFVSHTNLLLQPFDQVKLRPTGEAMPLAGGVTDGGAGGNLAFSVSDNGVLTYVSSASVEARLTSLLPTGQAVAQVGPIADYQYFFLSPDNKHVVAQLRTPQDDLAETWTIDLSTGAADRLTPGLEAFHPVWSPDGTRIAYKTSRGLLDQIFVKSANGTGNEEPLPVLSRAFGTMALNDWSADGQFLLFGLQDEATAVRDLWVLPLVGDRNARPFLRTHFEKRDGQFSPDGRWVTYSSDESGRFEVYVQSFPDAATKLQVSRTGGTRPRWQRDGQQLFYLAPDGTLMATSIEKGGTPGGGPAKPVFKTPNAGRGFDDWYDWYDVNSDGSRFLFAVPSVGTEPSITVILNWATAVKR